VNFLEKLNDINTFIFDVDGVLTNGELLILENGQLLRKMNTRDGYAMKKAAQAGYNVCIITGGKSEGVKTRLEGLGITDIFINIENKREVYSEYIRRNGINADNVLYMGDDLPDYAVMRLVGLPACPADAAHEISELAAYISPYDGGKGCVRDIIEKVLRLHGKWLDEAHVESNI